MASAIEQLLYGDAADMVSVNGEVGDYFAAEMCVAEGLISVRIASDRRPYCFRWVRFREAGLKSFSQTAAEPDDLLLPWWHSGPAERWKGREPRAAADRPREARFL